MPPASSVSDKGALAVACFDFNTENRWRILGKPDDDLENDEKAYWDGEAGEFWRGF